MYFKGQLAVSSIIFRMWNTIVCEYGKERSGLKMKLKNDNFQVVSTVFIQMSKECKIRGLKMIFSLNSVDTMLHFTAA